MPCSESKSRTIWLSYMAQAGRLALERVADVDDARLERDTRRQVEVRQVRDAAEVVPPGVREVLVEADPSRRGPARA